MDHSMALDDDSSLSVSDVTTAKKARVTIWDDEETNEAEKIAEQIVLCVVYGSGHVGMSYYETDTAQLYIMPDIAEAQDHQLVNRVLLEVQPSIILTTTKQDMGLKDILSSYVSANPSGRKLEILTSTEFRYDTCAQRVLNAASFPGVGSHSSDEERAMRIRSIVPMESVNLIRSLGAVLKYLNKKRIGIELEEMGTKVPILCVRRFTLDKLVKMDDTAFRSLRVFCRESHPSVYKSTTSSKEGLSLFGIANRTKSKLGSDLLRLWFLRPLCDIDTLRRRQDAIELLCRPRYSDVITSLMDCLKNIKNIPRILQKMSCSQLNTSDWQSLYKTAYNSIYVCDICRSLPSDIEIFSKIVATFDDGLHRVASLIDKIVDFEESAIQNRFAVKPGVDSDLDDKKQIYNGLPDLMTKVAINELGNLEEDVQECQVIYLPQLGYLLRFGRTSRMKTEEDFNIEGMKFVFLSEDHVHYKTNATQELDTLLGDTQCDIIDCETAIMHKLQSHILEYADLLLSVVECTAELDCLLSLSHLAMEHNYTRPEITEDNVIYIKKGRHPLQELCVSPFIPNDSCFDLEHGRMKIITGANASGKSVYLKQVGLIVYLAHIGSFVPAEAAKIGLMEGVYTRIQTRESISTGQSAFLIDLNQVSLAVNDSSAKSLILLDEFGKGTATVDGVSLLTSVLRYWLTKGNMCPNVLVSTHFHSVMQQKLLPQNDLIEYLTMETLLQGEKLVFLYQLIQGTCDTSFACHVASLAGLPEDIVKRGSQVSEFIRRNETIPIYTKGNSAEVNRICGDVVSKFLELDIEDGNVVAFLKDYVISIADGVI